MDLRLSPEQQELARSVEQFVRRDYSFEARRDITQSEAGWNGRHWQTFAELGWLGAGLSVEDGGFGGSAIESSIIAEGLGRALVLEPFLAVLQATQTLAAAPPSERRNALIDALVSGTERISVAHLEAAGRGDVDFVETIATPHGDGWTLSGSKSLVLGVPAADRLLISARHGGELGLFLVELDAPGLEMTPYRTLDDRRAADLTFSAAPGVALLANAAEALRAGVDHAIVAACAEAVGAMDVALWMTRDYVRTREQFGRPVGSFQACQHRLADMLVQCELARSMLLCGLDALTRLDSQQRTAGIAAAKAAIGEAGLFVGRQAIQLHGAIGMTHEHPIGHYYKRLFVLAHIFGSPDQHVTQYMRM